MSNSLDALKKFKQSNGMISENSSDIYRSNVYAELEKKYGRKLTDREKSRYRSRLRKNLQEFIATFAGCKNAEQKKAFKTVFMDYAKGVYQNPYILYGSSKSAEKSAEIDKFVSELEKIKD